MIDLHVHTTASDGVSRPGEIVAAAITLGITALAITDHDSVEGIDEAVTEASGTGLEVIPGVELSANYAGRDLHILGYFIDHRDGALAARLEQLREARVARAREMVDAMSDAGHAVTFEGVLRKSNGGAVGRSHIARALVDAGDVENVEDAFVRLIGRGGPFFVDKPLLPTEEAIALIRSVGGVPVLAHPNISGADDVISMLAAQGLLGLEAYHAEHDHQRQVRYAQIAEHLGLVATGGSDFHGAHAKGGTLGCVDAPPSCVEDLRRLARR